jgi:hypothetical protein
MNYVKHLIECQCTLSIFKNKTKPVYHKFPVFSKLIKDKCEEKYVMCENCNIIHRVTEVLKSEIKWGNESLSALVTTIDDIKFNLISNNFNNLVDLLEKNQCHISDWELAEYLIESKEKGNIILNKNEIDSNIVINLLEFNNGNFKLKKEVFQRYL